jgi:hypothetical protein
MFVHLISRMILASIKSACSRTTSPSSTMGKWEWGWGANGSLMAGICFYQLFQSLYRKPVYYTKNVEKFPVEKFPFGIFHVSSAATAVNLLPIDFIFLSIR